MSAHTKTLLRQVEDAAGSPSKAARLVGVSRGHWQDLTREPPRRRLTPRVRAAIERALEEAREAQDDNADAPEV